MMSETDVSGPQWQARSEHGSVGAVEASPVRDKAALVRGDVIHRPALEHELDEALARRLTLVIAGPGFGKSTLVGSWARRKPCAWYTATPGNASLANFARGLVDALRRSLPDFPSGAFTLVRHAVGEQDGQAEAIAGLVCQMLDDHLRADHVLVVDDSHELSASDQCVRLVEGLCRQAPARFHLVLCSRAEPPFPVERLRGRGEVLELDASRLAFSPAELDELLGSVLGRAEPELAGRLQEVTAGWPAAARLAVETLRISQPAERSDVLETLGRREGPVFSYFAEEVLRREPAPVQDLLRRVAPFDRVTVELCEALGAVAPGPKLASLVRRGLFVQPQRGAVGWFTLHALIREVVCALWPLGEGELRTLRRRAASWFETEGRLEAALDLRAEAGDGRGLTRLLMRHGRDLMLAGEGERVLRAAAIVPARLRGDEIDELLGLAHLHRGELDRARECLQSVAGDASKLPARLAWRLGVTDYPGGRLERALRAFQRGRIDGSDPPNESMLLGYAALTYAQLGDARRCRGFAVRALELATGCSDDHALANARVALGKLAWLEGDAELAEVHFRSASDAALRAGDGFQLVRARLNLGISLDRQGRSEEARPGLDLAITEAEAGGFAFLLPFVVEARGDTHIHRGRLDEAIADYRSSAALFRRQGSMASAGPLIGLADAYRDRGDLASARVHYEEAIALAEESDRPAHARRALAGLARVLVGGELAEARRHSDRALALGPGEGDVVALVAAGWVALSSGDVSSAGEAATAAVGRAGARDPRGLAAALELRSISVAGPEYGTAALEEAASIWRDLGDPLGLARVQLALARHGGSDVRHEAVRARRQLRRLGVRPTTTGGSGVLTALGQEAPLALAIQTLGRFRIVRQGVVVEAAEWRSRKARDALKILIARRGHKTPRDVLLETLWPGEEPTAASRRLSVALSTIRAILDPAHEFSSEHFLTGDRDAVALNVDHASLDIESFLVDAESALSLLRNGKGDEARKSLEAAEAAYTGDFLEEDAYADWAVALREEARAVYLNVVRALARIADDVDIAVRFRLRILEHDPYDEETQLGLAEVLLSAGRHGEARRVYRRYVARMGEIGVEPAAFPARSGATSGLLAQRS